MKRIVILILLVSSWGMAFANEDQVVVQADQLEKKEDKYYLNNVLFNGISHKPFGKLKIKENHYINGEVVLYRLVMLENSVAIHEIPFKDGERHGTLTMRRNDGSLMRVDHWSEGKRNGMVKAYYPDGSFSYMGYRVNGKSYGMGVCFEDSGFFAKCDGRKTSGDFPKK